MPVRHGQNGGPRARWDVDWERLARRAVILACVAAAVVELGRNLQQAGYGFDFHGGAWPAGHAVLFGHSPYPAARWWTLLTPGNAFVTPPPLAFFALPFSLVPWTVAVAFWGLACLAAFVTSLRVLGVKDFRLYLLAVCSWPFVSSLVMGQPDGIFALLLAVAWRYRDSWPGAAACGTLIAAKLLAMPLLLWLLVTRRFRQAAVGAASAVALLALTWACIGFKGLAAYPKLLTADARAFETRSHSVVAAAMRLGVSSHYARSLAIVCAIAVALAVVHSARGSDLGYFAAALLSGLLISPILWMHYLVVLFVPLAIAAPRFKGIWLLPAFFFLSPLEPPPSDAQVVLVLLTASAVSILAMCAARGTRNELILPRPASAREVRAAEPLMTFGDHGNAVS